MGARGAGAPDRADHSAIERRAALSLFREALKIDPDYALANVALGHALARNVNFGLHRDAEAVAAQALHHIDIALQNAPGDPDILVQAASANGLLGKRDRALQLAESAYAQSGVATFYYAEILAWNGRIDEAISHMREFLENSPSTMVQGLQRIMGVFLTVSGDFEEAVTFAEQARRLDPLLYLAHGDLANLYGHLGRYDEAREAWARVKALQPKSRVIDWENAWRKQYGSDEAVEALTGGYRKAGIKD